jgi:hypothetical protein
MEHDFGTLGIKKFKKEEQWIYKRGQAMYRRPGYCAIAEEEEKRRRRRRTCGRRVLAVERQMVQACYKIT